VKGRVCFATMEVLQRSFNLQASNCQFLLAPKWLESSKLKREMSDKMSGDETAIIWGCLQIEELEHCEPHNEGRWRGFVVFCSPCTVVITTSCPWWLLALRSFFFFAPWAHRMGYLCGELKCIQLRVNARSKGLKTYKIHQISIPNRK